MFARTEGVNTSYYLTDALNSTLALTDATGAMQTEYTYEPFGKTTQSGAANDSAYQYTGRENDGTGLMYYRARYYSPTMQRFISQDPIGFAGGDVNLYAYVFNKPISKIDPIGLVEYDPPINRKNPTLDPRNPPQPKPPGGIPQKPVVDTPKPRVDKRDSCDIVFKICMARCVPKCPGPPVIKGSVCGPLCLAAWIACEAGKEG